MPMRRNNYIMHGGVRPLSGLCGSREAASNQPIVGIRGQEKVWLRTCRRLTGLIPNTDDCTSRREKKVATVCLRRNERKHFPCGSPLIHRTQVLNPFPNRRSYL